MRGRLADEVKPDTTGPARWLAWTVAKTRDASSGCCYWEEDGWGWRGCNLEQQRGPGQSVTTPRTTYLEGAPVAVIMIRIDPERYPRIRSFSLDCDLDAGNMPVALLENVNPRDSIALLETFLGGADDRARAALRAIALHADPAADTALEKAATSPYLRRNAINYIGSARGARGFDFLSKQTPVNNELLSAMAGNSDPRATPWIAAYITPETENKLRQSAFSALSRQPAERAVPILIQTARTAKLEAIRRESVKALSRSRDPRAIAFLHEIIDR